MLYELNMEDFARIEITRERDSSGGWKTTQTVGETFRGALFENNTSTVYIAEKATENKTYKLFTEKGTGLKYHDIIKRISNGYILRVTSDGFDRRTPDLSNLNIERVMVERWDLSAD